MLTGPVIHPKFGDITAQVREALARKIRAKLDAQARRAKAAQQLAARYAGDRKIMRGLGQHKMVLAPDVYWHWYFREGPECWGDKTFCKDLIRDNPEIAARIEKPMDRVCFAGLDLPKAARPERPEPSRAQLTAGKHQRPKEILNQFGRAVA